MKLYLFVFILAVYPDLTGRNNSFAALPIQDENLELDTVPEIYYIHPEWIFDGEKIINGKCVLIKNGYIQKILDNNSQLPKDAVIIDASGRTLMPGLFDGHIHFLGPPMWQSGGVDKYGWGKMAEEGYSLFPQNRMNLLRNGITSIIDMGSPLTGYTRLRAEYEKGKIAGPGIYFPGPLFTAPKGHPAGTYYSGQHELITNGTVQVTDENKAREHVRQLNIKNVSFIKIVYDRMWYTTGGAPRLDIKVAKAIIDESHKLGIRVYAHIGSEEEALAMVEAGVDGIEHSFGSGVLSDSLFTIMARKKIFFTPTLAAFVHYAPKAVKPMQTTVKRAYEMGVIIVAGTDYPTSGGYRCGDDIYKEFQFLEEAGVSRIDVLKSATSNAALKAGVDSELGNVAVGCKANLIIVNGKIDGGNLTSDRIEKVFLEGNVVINKNVLSNSYKSAFKSKHIMVIPFCFPDPVTDFNFGLSYTDFDLFNSGVSLNSDLAYSIQNMWSLNLQFAVPTPLPKTRVKVNFHFDNMNRIYYGFGNNTIKSEAIEYSNLNLNESVVTTTTFRKHWKIYGNLTGEQTWINPAKNPELPDAEENESNMFIQAGIMGGLDLRDHENNPWKGLLLVFGGDISPEVLSSGRNFGNILFDFRGYIPTFPRHVIATKISYRQLLGEAPFYKFPSFGGPASGRGYFPQRFTDRIAIFTQLEYRFPVYKILSLTTWMDAGQVQPSVKDINMEFHPSFGFGPRVAFGSNENSILALDAGFSNEGFLVYFRTGHAF